MSLFGNLGTGQNQQQSGGSLFGSSLNNNSNQQKPSLFGGATTNGTQPQQNSLPFGQQQQAQQSSSAFKQQQQPQQSLSAFGQQQQPQQSSSLFGNSLQPGQQQQQQNPGTSLFGGGSNQPPPSTSVFGQTQAPQNNQQQNSNLFGSQNQAPQNTNGFGSSLLAMGSTQPQQQDLRQSRLQASLSQTMTRREKSIPEQMQIILRTWSPTSPECLMQHYFYNNVEPGAAPFWGPGPGENEEKWEEALAKKPSEGSIPLLVRGFQELGIRLSTQVQAVQQLQVRMHEMNNSLEAMMQKHELSLSVRAAEAKRKHIGLSAKCLGLAVKVQLLRSRGFVLDGAEEELKRKLATLEQGVFDPGFGSREEEIWARMVSLRERTRWLQEESERLGRQLASGEAGGLNEEVLKKTKKILSDYEAQISHLRKELGQVQQEFVEWETASKPSGDRF